MLHVPALPGSPHNRLDLTAITDWVLRDAESLVAGGVDAMILENFGDIPFFPDVVPPHTVAFLSVLAREVRRLQDVPLGINVLRNDGVSALGVATGSSRIHPRQCFYGREAHGSGRDRRPGTPASSPT